MFRPIFIPILLLVWIGGCTSPAPQITAQKTPDEIQKRREEKETKPPSRAKNEESISSVSSQKAKPEKQASHPTPKLSREEQQALFENFIVASFLAEKNYHQKAGDKYLEAFRLAPESPYLGAVTGKSLLRSGKIDEAMDIAENAIANGTSSAEVHHVLGRAYAIKQQWGKAIEHYETYLEFKPSSLDVMGELSSLYLRMNQFEPAMDLYRKMMQIDPSKSVIYQYKIASILVQLGRLDDALEEFQEIVLEVPHFFEGYIQIGAIHEVKGKRDEAIQAYLAALEYVRSSQSEIHIRHRLGRLYWNRNSHAEAFHQYSQIKKLDADDIQARRMLVSIFLALGKVDEALTEMEELAAKKPSDFQIQLLRRELLVQNGRQEEGFKKFIEAFFYTIRAQEKAECKTFLYEIARKAFLQRAKEMKLLGQVRKGLDKCLLVFPDLPRGHFAQTAFGLFTGEGDLIKKGMNSILSLVETSLEEKKKSLLEGICYEFLLWYRVRISFLQQAKSQELITHLEQAIETFNRSIKVLRTLSQLYIDSNQWASAENILLVLRDQTSGDSGDAREILLQLALVYDKKDQIDKVESLLEKAIAQYPQNAEVYNFLGYTYADRNIKLDKALSLIQKAHALDPEDGNIIDSLGWVYYRLGRYEDAVEQLKRAVALMENHPVILDHLGDALLQTGQKQKAIQSWKQALRYGPAYPAEFTSDFKQRIKQKIDQVEKQNLP